MKKYYLCLLAVALIIYAVWWWFMGAWIASIITTIYLIILALVEVSVAFNERNP